MELVYPVAIFIGIAIIIFLNIRKSKKTQKYENGTKVANTKYIKKTQYYQTVMKQYKILSSLLITLCSIAIFLSAILIARPTVTEVTDSSIYNRDIFLCMDVSASVDEVNQKLVESLKSVVNNLKGERFGISIFNTTSVLLVPLTDDYEYVLSVLDTLEKGFDAEINYDSSDENYRLRKYIEGGTLVGAEQRGGSIIGDGLANCIYSFTNLEEERTRAIILSTDNELSGEPIVTLNNAAELAKSKKITVYGIAPEITTEKDEIEFKKAVEKTGGELYKEDLTTVSNIVNSIENKEKKLLEGKKESRKIDKPQIPFVMLIISITALSIVSKRVNL